jgi:hypothetical protein
MMGRCSDTGTQEARIELDVFKSRTVVVKLFTGHIISFLVLLATLTWGVLAWCAELY